MQKEFLHAASDCIVTPSVGGGGSCAYAICTIDSGLISLRDACVASICSQDSFRLGADGLRQSGQARRTARARTIDGDQKFHFEADSPHARDAFARALSKHAPLQQALYDQAEIRDDHGEIDTPF